MNQVSNITNIEKAAFNGLDDSVILFNNIVSRSLKKHYENLGKYDLTNLRLIFLEKFNYLIEFSENKDADLKLYENIDNYFDFIDKNLLVSSKLDYNRLSAVIDLALVGIEDGIDLNSFYHFYQAYIMLRDSINKFKLSKKNYKEKRIY